MYVFKENPNTFLWSNLAIFGKKKSAEKKLSLGASTYLVVIFPRKLLYPTFTSESVFKIH